VTLATCGITLDHVHRLHALGLCVIPLKPGSKEADASWTPYQSARPTEAEYQAWFGNGVRRNAGIVTGQVSGVVVVESDSPEAEAWCAAHLPPTPMMTRSARGLHRYYLRPPVDTIPAHLWTSEGIKVEVKRDGQYVVAPGSVHPGDPEQGIPPGHVYSEVESWPDSLDALPFLPPSVFENSVSKRERAESLPAEVTPGSRNDALFREGCRLRNLGWEQPEIATALHGLNRERCDPPLPSGEVDTIAKSAARYDPPADTCPLTEAGDAEFFASMFADTARYDHRRSRWLHFRQHHWTPQITGEVHRMALAAIRARQGAATRITDTEKRKKHFAWAIGGEARKRQANMMALAQNVKPLADAGDAWDTDPWLLGVTNGVLDLRTGHLRDGRPADAVTKVALVGYDPAATCPRWDRFLREIFADHPEIGDYLQRAIGYALTGDTGEQVFWILFGEGANGKSTLMEVLMLGIFGPAYSWTMPFPTAGWSNAMSEYQKAELAGQRLVQASEVARRAELNEELIKSLTGTDSINARHPYGRPFSFEPAAKFFLRVNDKPVIRDQTHSMWRRPKLVPFTQIFPPNRTLRDTLLAEAPGILAWAVRGCLDWQRDGLRHPAVVEAATQEYRAESDPLVQFFADRCVIDSNAHVAAKDLFNAYQSWCTAEHMAGPDRLSQQAFGLRIRERFEAVEKRTVTYKGIGLMTRQEPPDGL
jgi:putative DNA primase/helicase